MSATQPMMRRHPRRGIAGANIQLFFEMCKEVSEKTQNFAKYFCCSSLGCLLVVSR